MRIRPRCPPVLPVLALLALAQGSPSPEVRTFEIPGTGVRFEMVRLPSGSFSMGSPETEAGRDDDEGPRHEVLLDAFWIGRREVSHDEYEIFRFRSRDSPASVDGAFDVDGVSRPSPPYEDPAHGMGKSGHPAVGMTRRAALRYARWLSGKSGRLFRLPTEAEWEYACRAGAADAYSFGGDPAGLERYGWSSDTTDTYREVGSLEPNAWGLFDLHGNVAEWVMDGYRADAYAVRAGATPVARPLVGDPPGGRGVVRGGSYRDGPSALRCAAREPEDARWKRRDPQIPKSRWWNTDAPHVGFRLASPAREMSREEIRAYWERIFERES